MSKDLIQIDDEQFDELMRGVSRPSWFEVAGYAATASLLTAVLFLAYGAGVPCGA